MINVEEVLILQHDKVVQWHESLTLNQTELPWQFIEENHKWNFSLWHEEDVARIKDIDNAKIVLAKRNIDSYNQARNNAIEKIDEYILSYLALQELGQADKMHSETPGMIIDRLSIMSLKRFHMFEETIRTDASEEHTSKCNNKVIVLDEQIQDLANCLKRLFGELELGELKFKVYRQFKMYNDPSLNPELYKRKMHINE